MDSIAYITSRKKQYDLKDLESRRTKLDIKDLPKNVSAFFNDKGYIDKTVDDLINYYKKSETYTKEEVQNLVSTRVLTKIVDKLPESNISTSTIYFLKRPKEDLPQSQYQSDVYDEYIYVDATWELIGNTYVDLTPYYTKEEVEVVIDDKILEERLIRENAEFILQSNIDSLEQETNNEITQIKQINLNQDELISNLETNLENEITRAINSENELANKYSDYNSHIENKNNPHAVNKVQVGLSEIENLPIDDVPTLNSPNYVRSNGVFEKLEGKVDKIDGKGLSDENFTYAEKNKLSNLQNYDDSEIVNNVNENTSAISVLNSDSTVEGSVEYKIKQSIKESSGLSFEVVEQLPEVGELNVIYFVLNSVISEGENKYDEFIWMNDKFELLGQTSTNVNLNNYYTKTEISALLSGKVDKDLSNVTGTLPIAKGGTGATTQKEAEYNLFKDVPLSEIQYTDETIFACFKSYPTTTDGVFVKKKAIGLWSYIKDKISDTLLKKLTSNENSLYYKLMKLVYPVGCLYWSSDSTNPSELFGGTWVQIKDRFILAVGDTYINNTAGGNSNVTLTVDEIPSHSHNVKPTGKIEMNSHSHSLNDHTHSFTPSGTIKMDEHSHYVSHTHGYTPSGTIKVNSHTHGLNEHRHSFDVIGAHSHGMVHYHDRGTMEITGEFAGIPAGSGWAYSGAFANSKTTSSSDNTWGTSDAKRVKVVLTASNGWSGRTSKGYATQTTTDTTLKDRTDLETISISGTTGKPTTDVVDTKGATATGTFTGTKGTTTSESRFYTDTSTSEGTFTGTAGTTGGASVSTKGATATGTFIGNDILTTATGKGESFSIMPPYIVKYCWERTK